MFSSKIFTIKLSVVFATFFSLTLTGILVASPVDYVPAPGGLFVIVPEQQEDGEENDEQGSWALQADPSETGEGISSANSGGGINGSRLSGQGSQDAAGADGNWDAQFSENGLDVLGEDTNENALANRLLEQASEGENQQTAQRVAMARAAPTIDNYANASYDGRNDPVGHVAADFAVNANGAATYNIPIAIPPGIAEVQPSISLTYNSQSGDGIAGKGVDIAGLSRITRCGSTLAQDGIIRPVQLDSGDHFCLDGQRLIETSRSGTTIYYQTEIKGYDEITASFSSYYNQPTKFTVKTIAGETIEYGGDYSAQLRLTKPNSTALFTGETDVRHPFAAWLIYKTSDIKGNYIRYRYSYYRETSGTEHLLRRIEYTGTQFTQPYAAIHFDYEERLGSKTTTYLGGGALYQSKRLHRVRVTQGTAGSHNTTTVRAYNLDYHTVDGDSTHNYDRLMSVEECANYTDSGHDIYDTCLPPTWFRWGGGYNSQLGTDSQGNAVLFGSQQVIASERNSLAARPIQPTEAELQGDDLGITQFDGQESDTDPTLYQEYGYGDPNNPNWLYGTYKDNDDPKKPGKDFALIGDVNGDGLTDLVGLKGIFKSIYSYTYQGLPVPNGYSYDYQVVVSTSNGKTFQKDLDFSTTTALFTDVPLVHNSENFGNAAFLADVNADGMSDLVLMGFDNIHIALSNGESFDAAKTWNVDDRFTGRGGWSSGGEQRYVFDVNGDGRADLVGLEDDGIYAALSTENNDNIFGTPGRISAAFTVDNSNKYQFEVDEDEDLPIWETDIADKIKRFSFADVNGDGLPDAIRLSKNGIEVALNKGKPSPTHYFTTPVRWDQTGSIWGDASLSLLISTEEINSNLAYWLNRFFPHTFADVNGDGMADFVLFTQLGVKVAFSTGNSFTAPTDAFGENIASSFGRFSDQYNITNPASQLGACHSASVPYLPSYNYYPSATLTNRSMWVDERKDPRYLVDVNGDGRSDILGFGSNGIYVSLSQGNTFAEMRKWIDPNDTSFSYDACWQPGYNIRSVADVTGDGMVDLLGIGFTGTHVGQNFVKSWRVEQIISGGYIPLDGSTEYDGLHRSIDIDYDVLTTSTNYSRGEIEKTLPLEDQYQPNTIPYTFRKLPIYVVSAHHDSDGEIGSIRPHRSTLNYHYHDLKIDPKRGIQGFRAREVIDDNAKTRTEEFYHQYFPLTGRPYVQRTYAYNASHQEKMVKEVATTLDATVKETVAALDPHTGTTISRDIHEVLLESTLETDFTLDAGSRFKQLRTEYKAYDDCGQAGEISKSLGNWNGNSPQPHEAAYDVITLNDYPTTGSCRDKSRFKKRHRHPHSHRTTRSKQKSEFVYYPIGHEHAELLHQETVEPDTGDEQEVTTTYDYNSIGQITDKTISGLGGRIDKDNDGLRSDPISRKTTTNYTSDYRFISSTVDPLNFTTQFEYDKRFGLVKKTTDANGLISQTRYNGLGQPYLKEGPQGGVTHIAYEWCDTDVRGARARYCVTTKNLNVATSQYAKQYFDSVDRLLREESMGANTNGGAARKVYKDKIYDVETGRLLQESLPYYFNPPKWVTYTYDALGRTLTVEQPDGSDTTMTYNGLTSTTTNDKEQTTTQIRTPRGKVVKAIDAIGGSVNHVYDSLGHLKTTTVTAKEGANNTGADRSITTSFTYDLRGNKQSMTDPDMGTWHYYYNALGEMTLQVDAKDQDTVFTYDSLGRRVKRKSADEKTDWNYYPQSEDDENKRGRLKEVISEMTNHKLVDREDNNNTTYTYKKTFIYNEYGQPKNIKEEIPGKGGFYNRNGNTYEFDYTYDSWGRPETLTYPKIASDQPTVGITYQYDTALGHLEAISDSNNASLKHWELTGVEADGQTQREILGGKVTTTYNYDTLRRPWITGSSKVSGGSVQLMEYDFDSLGNLTLRRDYLNNAKETFDYDDLNRLTATHTTYAGISTPLTTSNTYDGHGNLRSKDGFEFKYGDEPPYGAWFGSSFHQVNQILENGNFRELRSYDANGNITDAGQGRQLTWNSFNKPSYIQRLGPTARFLYNSDHQRMFQSATAGWTWYAGGGLLEHVENRSTNRETMKYALMVNGKKLGYIKQSFDRGFAPITGWQATNQTNDTFYLLNDHLGSPQALLDSNGNKLEDLSFTAWGERRAASWNPGDAVNMLTLTETYALTRGFTGHEHDDTFGFINMKGRLYDPVLGRFLSADPFVQFAHNTQSYNRYSYVLNNPLSFTDPSGYFLSGLKKFFRKYLRPIAAIAVEAALMSAGLPPGLVAFTMTIASGGSLESAVQNAFFATISAGVTRYIGSANPHNPGGGIRGAIGRGMARWGEWGETFRSIVHGAAQGTISWLQGRKFGHGFASAFVSHQTAGLGKRLGLGTPRDGHAGRTIGRTMLAAAIGGTVSEITGGKFANGARTAAFVHLFNAESDISAAIAVTRGYFRGGNLPVISLCDDCPEVGFGLANGVYEVERNTIFLDSGSRDLNYLTSDLSDQQAWDLLNTVIHEHIHANQRPYEWFMMQHFEPEPGKGFGGYIHNKVYSRADNLTYLLWRKYDTLRSMPSEYFGKQGFFYNDTQSFYE